MESEQQISPISQLDRQFLSQETDIINFCIYHSGEQRAEQMIDSERTCFDLTILHLMRMCVCLCVCVEN